jgi:hypothetical protein
MRILFLLPALAGCAMSPAGPGAPSGPPMSGETRAQIEASEAPFRFPGTVAARLGQEVRLGDIRIRPLAVVEDSRCPLGVTCVWAGRLRVRVAVSGAGEPVMELNRPVAVPGGRRLTLVAVAPPKWHRLPPGVDPHAPQRFAFRLAAAD